jgi:hypothetical protein
MLCYIFLCFCRAHLCSPPSSGFSVRLQALGDSFNISLCATLEREILNHVPRANVFLLVTFFLVSQMRRRPGIFGLA